MYKKKSNPLTISTIEDAKKVGKIGTYNDDSKEQLLKKLGFNNLDSSPDDLANPKKLIAGRIDLWISTSIQAKPTCISAGIDPDSIETTISLLVQKMYLAFSTKTSDSTVQSWQNAFDGMVKDGTYKKIIIRWEPTLLDLKKK